MRTDEPKCTIDWIFVFNSVHFGYFLAWCSYYYYSGEFGIVYRAYLSDWMEYTTPCMVAVKTMKGD